MSETTTTEPAADTRDSYKQIEDAILDDGGRCLATSGKLNRRGQGFEASLYILRGGRTVIMQRTSHGPKGESGCEVYAPLTADMTIAGTIAAIHAYAAT